MTFPSCRAISQFVICFVAAICAVTALGQDAVLQLVSLGPAAGSIDSSSPGISCTGACYVAVSQGGSIVLTANPAPGGQFKGWAGDCAGADATCTLIMDGTKLVGASFTRTGDPFQLIRHFLPGSSDGSSPAGGLLAFDGYVYGTTSGGGRAGSGTVFRELPDGSRYTVLHDFLGGTSDGSEPSGSLIEAGGVLYGMTVNGGAGDNGTVFKLNPDGSGFALVHSFAGYPSDGSLPVASLLAFSGALFGATSRGGGTGCGALFRVNPDGSGFEILHSFTGDPDGFSPSGALVAFGGTLYGMTWLGGPAYDGTVFKIGLDGTGFTLLHSFAYGPSDAQDPSGSLLASGGVLYGVAGSGGANGEGAIFKISPDGTSFSLVYSFSQSASYGVFPTGPLMESGGALYGVTFADGDSSLGTLFKVSPDGSGFQVLHSFAGDATDGSGPSGSLLALGGLLLGMTTGGGADGGGTVFEVRPDGKGFALLRSFGGYRSDGAEPSGSLAEAGGVLYGMTVNGGADGDGTVFKVNPDGSGFAILHSFAGYPTDGAVPTGSLVSLGGALYGMTMAGGPYGGGTVFELKPDGSGYSIVYPFYAPMSGRSSPTGSLVAVGGALYGMIAGIIDPSGVFRINPDGSGLTWLATIPADGSVAGGPTGSLVTCGSGLCGTSLSAVFSINPDGSGFTTLHSFAGGSADGSQPSGSLLALDHVLYGMTYQGGAADLGTIFKVNLDGTGFALLHSFGGGANDGAGPIGSLSALGNVLYGMASSGGERGAGAVFKVNLDGDGFALIHSFAGGDGAFPLCEGFGCFGGPAWGLGSLGLTAVGGDLYGAAPAGGLADSGVLFRLDLERRVRRHLLREQPADLPELLEVNR